MSDEQRIDGATEECVDEILEHRGEDTCNEPSGAQKEFSTRISSQQSVGEVIGTAAAIHRALSVLDWGS